MGVPWGAASGGLPTTRQGPVGGYDADMQRRVHRYLAYRLERFLVGGALYRFAFIGFAIVAVVVLGGTALWYVEGDGSLNSWLTSLWWCFLRLTDPGYLGDDEGSFRRTLSTIVTVLGYVLFMGALIAIMTAWLHETLRRLESGLTPIGLRGHLVILGWSERTPEILLDLLAANRHRLRIFLRRHRVGRLRVAILAKEAGPTMEAELRQRLGSVYDRRSVILRGGEAQNPSHLDRVAWQDAAAIVVAGGYTNVVLCEGCHPDARLLRTLLSLATPIEKGRHVPRLVVPVIRQSSIPVLQQSYPPERLSPLCTPLFVGRLLAQAIRHPGLMPVFKELLTQSHGNAIYLRGFQRLVGRSYGEAIWQIQNGIAIGILAGDGQVHLCPPLTHRLSPTDQFILIAEDYNLHLATPAGVECMLQAQPRAEQDPEACQRLLILGNSRLVPIVLEELHRSSGRQHVRCLSRDYMGDKRQQFEHYLHLRGSTEVELVGGDYLEEGELLAIRPAEAEAILLLSPDRFASVEEADARALMGHQLLRTHFAQAGVTAPRICLELRSPDSAELMQRSDTETLIGGEVVSHALAQIALRPDLLQVYDELFVATGFGLKIESAKQWQLAGPQQPNFLQLRRTLAGLGAVLIGVVVDGQTRVNPPGNLRLDLAQPLGLILLRD